MEIMFKHSFPYICTFPNTTPYKMTVSCLTLTVSLTLSEELIAHFKQLHHGSKRKRSRLRKAHTKKGETGGKDEEQKLDDASSSESSTNTNAAVQKKRKKQKKRGWGSEDDEQQRKQSKEEIKEHWAWAIQEAKRLKKKLRMRKKLRKEGNIGTKAKEQSL